MKLPRAAVDGVWKEGIMVKRSGDEAWAESVNERGTDEAWVESVVTERATDEARAASV